MKKGMFNRQVQRFSLRKCSYGTASVLLGTLLFSENNVQADSAVSPEVATVESSVVTDVGNTSESETNSEATVYVAEPLLSVTEPEPETEIPSITSIPELKEKEGNPSDEEILEKTSSLKEDNTSIIPEAAGSGEEKVVAKESLASSMFRAAKPGETQVYGPLPSLANQPGGKITDFRGYLVPEGHTDTTELIRFELDYTPTVVNGRASQAPISLGYAAANNFQVIANSFTVNGQKLPASGAGDGLTTFWSPNVKANIGQKNKIEFYSRVVTSKIDYGNINLVVGTANNPNYNRFFSPDYGSSNTVVRNSTLATVHLDLKAFKQAVEEIVGPKIPDPKVETSPIPFTTEYKADETLEVNSQQVEREGVDGEQTITTTYRKDGNEVVEVRGEPVVTKEPVSKVVKVGTKATVVTEPVPYKTVYENDPSMKSTDPEIVVTEGKEGSKTTTTTYTLDTTTGVAVANTPTVETVDAIDKVIRRGTGQSSLIPYKTVYVANDKLEAGKQEIVVEGIEGLLEPNGSVSREAVDKVIQVGTESKVTEKTIPYQVSYRGDDEKELGWESISNAGVVGLEQTTTSYTLNTETGEVKASEPITVLVRPAINRVYRIGTKPSVEVSTIPFETTYIDDVNMKSDDPEIVVTEGQDGKKTVKITYTVNVNDGTVTPSKPVEEIVEAVNRVIRRGVGQESKIPFETLYEASMELAAGEQQVVTPGVEGTRHPDGSISVAPINQVIQVGVKPLVVETVLNFETVYQDDATMKATDPEVVVVEGQNGLKTVTTTYSLNSQDGQVTANTPTEVLVAAVNRVVKRGVGQESKIPFETLYVASMELAAGEQQVVTPGVEGTRHPNGSISVMPINQVIQVGVKPLVVETVLNFETVYQDDATMKAADPEVVVVEGQNGLKTVTTTYSLNSQDGQVTANTPTEVLVAAVNRVIKRGVGQDTSLPFDTVYMSTTALDAGTQQILTPGVEGVRHPNGSITKEAVAQIIQVGVKPLIVSETLPYQTVYQEDAAMKADDPEVLVQAGQAGERVTTTSYVMDEKTGLVTAQTPVVLEKAAVDQIIKRGVGQETEIPFTTVYLGTNSLEAGQKVVVIAGQKGLRHPNGSITKEAIAELVQVGVKPVVMTETLPYQTVYQEDTSMKASDPEVLVQVGQAGQRVTTTNYVMDEKTGLVSAQTPVVQETAAVNQIIKRGVGQDKEIPFTTVYLATTELAAGEQQVLVAGQVGLRHPNGSVTREMVPAMIQVGIKPVVATEALAYQTIHQEDPSMLTSDPEVVVQAGKAGQRVTTTNYRLNQATGQVTALTPIVMETAAIDQIIKRGVGQNTELPFETHYVADATLAAGETDIRIQGQHGVRHPNGSISKEVVDQIVAVGTRPSQRTETVAFATRYLEASGMAANSRQTVVEGQTGQKTFTITYVLNTVNGQVIAQPETETLTIQPVTEVIEVGTRPSQRIETVAFATRYLEDKEMAANSRRTLVEGQTGQKTFTVSYVLDTANGQVTAQPETEALTIKPVAEVIEVGTKPTMRTVELEFSIVYQEDKEMTAGQQVVDQEGQKGLDTYTTTYVLDVETGQVIAQPEVVERTSDPVARVVRVGVKPLVVETELAFETVYQDDPMMLPTDQEVVLIEGQAGKEIRTTNYVLDIQTGQVTAQEPIVERQEAVNRLVKRGVGQTSPIAFKIIYKGDVTLTAGQRVIDQEGQEGVRHPNGSILKEAVDQIIRVGLKPVEKVEELPFEEEVIEDSNLPLGQICVEVEGQVGNRITRITYSLNPETGEVMAHESVETVAPVKRIVRKGTKVEETCPPVESPVVESPVAEVKTLPNTGTADSATILVAGGLAGLASLGVIAKKREED
ncbi:MULTISPECIES: G5 domain-containing protein [unclassified Streptococcus]|uniref:G5 domain-containing protein n=1 Tax=unclassified Streptococcus TaxID=2608887 RepID=UPI001071B4C3|nr:MULTISPECIES: G5 domain-containing protein [unclassified Streptococcus]MBF0805720.1 G5 domain-containing protein [Streptococcus sp. 19428wA2_WM07]TFU28762.1 YSIRK-type signal peptide-containing protein [Streptococcus sp. WM07]